jgi:hypothetical protein
VASITNIFAIAVKMQEFCPTPFWNKFGIQLCWTDVITSLTVATVLLIITLLWIRQTHIFSNEQESLLQDFVFII